MHKRALGATGLEISVLGFGGIAVMNVDPDEAADTVARAVELGINYFDVAPGYGNAEERLGPALETFRDSVNLACKTGNRTKDGARADLERSLTRLRTDHVDVYQHHGVSTIEQADEILAPGGALEAFRAAREEGLVRNIGFSAHSEEAALRLIDGFDYDTVMLPVNMTCWSVGKFGRRVVETASSKGMGILALKALARRPWHEGEKKRWAKCWYAPIDTLPEAKAALAFTLAQPIAAAISPGHAELLWLACEAVEALESVPGKEPTAKIENAAPIFQTTG